MPHLSLTNSVTKASFSSIGSVRIETIIGDRTYDPFKIEVSATDFKVVYIWFLNTYALSLGQPLGNLKEGSVWYLLLLNEKDKWLQNDWQSHLPPGSTERSPLEQSIIRSPTGECSN